MNKKAIIVYIDDNEKNIEEFSWLYKTWVYWKIYNQYDLLTFINPLVENKIPNHKNLIKIHLEPLNKPGNIWYYYPFVNSFAMFRDKKIVKQIREKYDYILKTDCDVFLTKHILDLEPERALLGRGGYMTSEEHSEEILSKLIKLSKKLNLNYNHINHVGASIFATTDMVMQIVNKQFVLTDYLLKTEFSKNIGEWPGWFGGVSSMYAMHLSVNHHLMAWNTELNVLDLPCLDNLICTRTFHIHAWHTKTFFSKHRWFEGKYEKLISDEPPKKANEYCLWVASNDINEQTISNDISEQTISNDISEQTISNDISEQTISNDISEQTISNDITEQTISNDISEQTISNDINIKYNKIFLQDLNYYFLSNNNQKRKQHLLEEFQNFKLYEVNPKPHIQNKFMSGSSGFNNIIYKASENQEKNEPFKPFIIFEDDVTKYKEFPKYINIPEDTDILYIGLSRAGLHNKGSTLDTVCFKNIDEHIIKIYNMLSTHGLMICSIRGLLILQKCMTISYLNKIPWDIMISISQPYFNIYALKEPLVYQCSSLGGIEDETKINYLNKDDKEYPEEWKRHHIIDLLF